MKLTVLVMVGMVSAGLVVPALAEEPVAATAHAVVAATETPEEIAPNSSDPAPEPSAPGKAWRQGQPHPGALLGLFGQRLGLSDEDKKAIKDAAKELQKARQAARQKLAAVLRPALAKKGKEEELSRTLAEFREAKEKLEAVQREVDRRLREQLKLSEGPRVEAALLLLGILDNGLGRTAFRPGVGARMRGWGRTPIPAPGLGLRYRRGQMGYPGLPPQAMRGGGFGPRLYPIPQQGIWGWGGGWPGMGERVPPFGQTPYGIAPVPPPSNVWQPAPAMLLSAPPYQPEGEEDRFLLSLPELVPESDLLEYLW